MNEYVYNSRCATTHKRATVCDGTPRASLPPQTFFSSLCASLASRWSLIICTSSSWRSGPQWNGPEWQTSQYTVCRRRGSGRVSFAHVRAETRPVCARALPQARSGGARGATGRKCGPYSYVTLRQVCSQCGHACAYPTQCAPRAVKRRECVRAQARLRARLGTTPCPQHQALLCCRAAQPPSGAGGSDGDDDDADGQGGGGAVARGARRTPRSAHLIRKERQVLHNLSNELLFDLLFDLLHLLAQAHRVLGGERRGERRGERDDDDALRDLPARARSATSRATASPARRVSVNVVRCSRAHRCAAASRCRRRAAPCLCRPKRQLRRRRRVQRAAQRAEHARACVPCRCSKAAR